MLADQLDYVVGVDPHPNWHALAVVGIVSGAVVVEATVAANSDGYAQALQLVERHAPGRRAFAVEGTGSFGAGLTRFLTRPPVACLPRSVRRHYGLEGNARRYRPWWPPARAPSTPNAPRSVSCEIC
jgi:hypothetical protein